MMKVEKATITFTAYGINSDDAIENLLFDISEVVKQEGSGIETRTVDTEEEGIDDFEENMPLDEVVERNLKVDIKSGQVLDEYFNVYCDESGCACFLSQKELKVVKEALEYKGLRYE